MITIYLAGPIFQCSDDESTDWRQEVKKRLKKEFQDYFVFDPFDRDLRGREDDMMREIVEGDKELIDKSDILLVGLWKVSAGTCMEILYAWERGKKTFIINGLDKISPWLRYHSHAIFNNIDQAINHLKKMRV